MRHSWRVIAATSFCFLGFGGWLVFGSEVSPVAPLVVNVASTLNPNSGTPEARIFLVVRAEGLVEVGITDAVGQLEIAREKVVGEKVQALMACPDENFMDCAALLRERSHFDRLPAVYLLMPPGVVD